MHAPKVAKSQQDSKSAWSIVAGEIPKLPSYVYSSVDPGQKNLAIHIAIRTGEQLRTLALHDIDVRGGGHTEQRITLFDNIDGCFTELLKKHNCTPNIAINERQPPLKVLNIRVAQAVQDFFRHICRTTCVIEIDPQVKRKWMGLKKGVDKATLKHTAIVCAAKIAYLRQDAEVFTYLRNYLITYNSSDRKKKLFKADDMADAYLQGEIMLEMVGLVSDLRNFFANVNWQELSIY